MKIARVKFTSSGASSFSKFTSSIVINLKLSPREVIISIYRRRINGIIVSTRP